MIWWTHVAVGWWQIDLRRKGGFLVADHADASCGLCIMSQISGGDECVDESNDWNVCRTKTPELLTLSSCSHSNQKPERRPTSISKLRAQARGTIITTAKIRSMVVKIRLGCMTHIFEWPRQW